MRYYDQTKTYNQLREMSDRICEEHGLSVIRTPEHSSLSYADWQKGNDEMSCTKKHLYEDLDTVLEYVTSFEQFKREIQNRGYVLEYRGSFLRIRPDERKKMIICELFNRIEIGRDYTIKCDLNFTYKQFCTEWATLKENITATA